MNPDAMPPLNPHLWRKFEQAGNNMLRCMRHSNNRRARKWFMEMKRLRVRLMSMPQRKDWRHKSIVAAKPWREPAAKAGMQDLKKGPENPTS